MPCSDGGAYDYINDHRTQSLEKNLRDREKEIRNLNSQLSTANNASHAVTMINELDEKLKLAEDKATEFANKLNNVTAMLCKSTHLLHTTSPEVFTRHQDLMDWYNQHQEEDVKRMLSDIGLILKKKKGQLKAVIKWSEELSPNEKVLLETRNEFKNLSLTKIIR